MKYWEMISDGLRRKGWSVGWFKFTSTIDGRQMWSADARQDDSARFVVQAEELGAAFLELEMQCERAAFVGGRVENGGEMDSARS